MSTSLAVGLCAGLSDKREVRRAVPAFVRSGNLARITAPVVWEVFGRRSDRALGRRLKPGQVASVGIPQSSKIWNGQQGIGSVTFAVDESPLQADPLHSCLVTVAASLGARRIYIPHSTDRSLHRTSLHRVAALEHGTTA